jgi:hypothetical protein
MRIHGNIQLRLPSNGGLRSNTSQYCEVFGRMPSSLGNLKLDAPVVARQPKVKHLHGYARD